MSTDAGYEGIEARLRKRKKMKYGAEWTISTTPDPDCLEAADALADMRRQLDEARRQVGELDVRGFTERGKRISAQAELADLRKQAAQDTLALREAIKQVEAIEAQFTDMRAEADQRLGYIMGIEAHVERLTRERDEAIASRDSYLKHTQPAVLKRAEAAEAEMERLLMNQLGMEVDLSDLRRELDESRQSYCKAADERNAAERERDRYKALAEVERDGDA